MMTTMDPRSQDLAICIRQITNINFCNVRFEKWKGVTYDDFSRFMKPFTQYGESNLVRIERQFANLPHRGEQSMDSPML